MDWNAFLKHCWEMAEPTVAGIVGAMILLIISALLTAARTWAATLKDKWYAGLVRTAVAAAEQKFKEQAGSGKQKREWVAEQLKKRGLDTDEAHLEAAVHALTLLKNAGDNKTGAVGEAN